MTEFNIEAASRRIAEEFAGIGNVASPDASGEGSFGKVLGDVLRGTNETQLDADKAVTQLVSGEADNVQDVMLAMAKADLSFRMMLEVRNKLMDAYQEVMRTNV